MVKRLALSTLALFVAAVAGLLGLALSKPDSYHVQREIEIAAPASTVWENLHDFRRWTKWSPWEHEEAGVERSYAGPASGVGASYAWQGKDIGSGELRIEDSKPPERLAIRLQLSKPLPETNQLSFELTPSPATTHVSWSMSGPRRFAARLLSVIVSTDAFIARDLDRGLERLKLVCERK